MDSVHLSHTNTGRPHRQGAALSYRLMPEPCWESQPLNETSRVHVSMHSPSRSPWTLCLALHEAAGRGGRAG